MRKNPKRTTDAPEPDDDAEDLLANTMPPTPLRDLLAADGASVYVLTDDAALLETVREAGGEQYPVFSAGSWQGLKEAVAEKRCGIALLDIEAVKGPLTSRLAELAKLAPALVTLVASHRNSADGLLNLLSERKIHRLLIKPPTPGITRLLLESSVSRHIELRQRPESHTAPQQSADTGFAGWWSWLLAGSLVAAVVAAVAITGVLDQPAAPPVNVTSPAQEPPAARVLPAPAEPAAVTPATQVTPAVAGEPAVLSPEPVAFELGPLERAEPATLAPVPVTGPASVTEAEPVAAEPVVEPLAVPPDPVAAPLTLDERFAAVESALIDEDLDAAGALLADIALIDPASSRLAFLQAQLERERLRVAAEAVTAEEAAAAQAAAAAAAAVPNELASLLGLARTRLEQGQVVAPPGDSALDYYARARAVDPAAQEVAALQADLGAAVLTEAEVALADGRFAAAETLFVEAEALGISDEDLVALELSLVYARESLTQAAQDELLAEAQARLAQGRVFEPESGSALAALLEARQLDPDYAGLGPGFAALGQALQGAAESALAAADWDRAAAAIGALGRSGAASTIVDPLRGELDFAQTQAAFLANAAPASELNVIEFEPPVYPSRAVLRGTQGWVDLEFVVDRQGLPRDVRVTAADPEGEFETAALTAAATYVYEPFERDGRVFERRVSLRMRFALE